jgi:hypothetical protein
MGAIGNWMRTRHGRVREFEEILADLLDHASRDAVQRDKTSFEPPSQPRGDEPRPWERH